MKMEGSAENSPQDYCKYIYCLNKKVEIKPYDVLKLSVSAQKQ